MAVNITAAARNNRGAAALSLSVSTGTGTAVVQRVLGDSTALIRENPIPVTTTPVEVLDYEVPLGVPVTYLVTLDETGDTAQTAPLVVSGNGQDFMVSLSDPSRSVAVTVVEMPDTSYQTRVTLLPIIGRNTPVAQTDFPQAATGTLTILTQSPGERDALTALIRDGWPVLFKSQPERGVGNRYMALTGITTYRVSPLAKEPMRRTVIEYATVDATASIYTPQAAGYTWDQLILDVATWDAVPTQFARWNDVPLGPNPGAFRGPLGGF